MDWTNRKVIRFFSNTIQDMKKLHDRTLEPPESELYEKFLRQLNIFYLAFDCMHSYDLQDYFEPEGFTRENVHHLLAFHCLKMLEDFRNIFIVLTYCYSFAYSLLSFCRKRGHDFFEEISGYMTELFLNNVHRRFYEGNGFNGLRKFCSVQKLHDVLDFISACYCDEGKLLTDVPYRCIGSNYENGEIMGNSDPLLSRRFGMHHKSTLALLQHNLLYLKRLVFLMFQPAISTNPYYRSEVIISFISIDSRLKHVIMNSILQNDVLILTNPLFGTFREYLTEDTSLEQILSMAILSCSCSYAIQYIQSNA